MYREQGRKFKLPVGEHYSNNCCRKNPPIDAKISGQEFEKKRNRVFA